MYQEKIVLCGAILLAAWGCRRYAVRSDCHRRYVEYRANSDYAGLGVPTEGDDFFAQSLKESARLIYPEDMAKFQTLLTRENVLNRVGKDGFFSFQYRMVMDGEPRYVSLKAALVDEADGPVLVIGVSDIDAQMKEKAEYELARRDSLTYEHIAKALSKDYIYLY